MSSILPILSELGTYNLWLWTLALNFASSLILADAYLNGKGTPIGRSAFYLSITAFLWTIISTIMTIPILLRTNVFENWFYVIFSFLAAITLSLQTYERARIQVFLTPGTKEQTQDNHLWFILSLCVFAVAIIGVTGIMLNNPIIRQGGLTDLGFILIAGLFIALTHPKFTTKLVYVGSAILLILGFNVIIGIFLQIPILYSPLPGGPTTFPTALVFMIAGLWIATAKLSGLKWWLAKITMAMAILSSVPIQFVNYFLHHPTTLSFPTLLLMVLVGGAILWRSWKTPNR